MLVLSNIVRHRDEEIMIGDNIVLSIRDIRGDRVRIGITAPSDVRVHRGEVYAAILREKRKASLPKEEISAKAANAAAALTMDSEKDKQHQSPG